jgi:hypothetical protein
MVGYARDETDVVVSPLILDSQGPARKEWKRSNPNTTSGRTLRSA